MAHFLHCKIRLVAKVIMNGRTALWHESRPDKKKGQAALETGLTFNFGTGTASLHVEQVLFLVVRKRLVHLVTVSSGFDIEERGKWSQGWQAFLYKS